MYFKSQLKQLFSSCIIQRFEINLGESPEVKINDTETKESPDFIIDLDTQNHIVQGMLKRFTDIQGTETNEIFKSAMNNFKNITDEEKIQYKDIYGIEPQAPELVLNFDTVDIDQTPAQIRTMTYMGKQYIMFSVGYVFTDGDGETFKQGIARDIGVPGDCGINFREEEAPAFFLLTEEEKTYINSLVSSTCYVS